MASSIRSVAYIKLKFRDMGTTPELERKRNKSSGIDPKPTKFVRELYCQKTPT